MKYETPEVTALMPAIIAVQSSSNSTPKNTSNTLDSSIKEHVSAAYEDWED